MTVDPSEHPLRAALFERVLGQVVQAIGDIEEQTKVVALLDPSRIGAELSEEFQLHPEQSTSTLVVHHPEANYFAAG